jgi:hypothetical protein
MLKHARVQAEIPVVAEQECAHCGAKLANGAAWCSLCYAPVVEPALVGAGSGDELRDELEDRLDGAQPDEPDGAWELPFDGPSLPRTGDLLVADIPVRLAPAASADAETDAKTEPETDRTAGSWPCVGCAALNPMGESVCHACGLPFLAHAKTPPVLNIPGLGDIFQRSRPQQIAFLAASGVVLLAALLALMAIFSLVI